MGICSGAVEPERSYKTLASRTQKECWAIESDSLVDESDRTPTEFPE
jgi:hypothetical protein